MKSDYTTVWDIIEVLLKSGAILYGPGVKNLLYPPKQDPYFEDNLIRAHFYSENVHDIYALDQLMTRFGYTEIVETSDTPYVQGDWYYTTYELSPNIVVPFVTPRVRISVRPYISYAIRIIDSLCLLYDDGVDEYRFFYSGICVWKDNKWRQIHDISCAGYIRVRSLRNKRHLAKGKSWIYYTGLEMEYSKNRMIVHLGDKYRMYRQDNPYLC